MSSARLSAIHTYPVKGEPGRDLSEVGIGSEGLDGDRRKKAPVHVVAAEEVADDTRANLVVGLSAQELAASVGELLRVGEVELQVTSQPSQCPGVYAVVRLPGRVRLGDTVSTGIGSERA
jgi:uncharacterized protein YcbX